MGLNFGRKIEVLKTAVAKCDDASLMESIDKAATASAALYECQADGVEICQVIDNLTLVAQAIANGGVTKQVLGAFNSEGELGAACGIENLTVAGLEAMAAEDIATLQKKISAGLEGQMAEYWAKMVEWLKNIWTKMVEWLKSQFTNQAKYVSALEAAKASLKEVNSGTEVATHSKSEIVDTLKRSMSLIADLKTASEKFKNKGKIADAAKVGGHWYKADDQTVLEKYNNGAAESKTLKDAGFKAVSDVTGAIDEYIKVAKSGDFANASKNFTDGLAGFIKDAENAAKLEGEAASNAKATISSRRQEVNELLKMVRMVASTVQKCGGELLKVTKAAGVKVAAAK